MTDAQAQQPLALPPTGARAAALEALLFASAAGEDERALADALEWPLADVRAGLAELETQLRADGRGLRLQRAGAHAQLVTAPEYGAAVARLLGQERTARLSGAALETLALVAYRQPVTRAEIEAVRGVDSSGVLATLLARELVEATGRRAAPGAPVEYATTTQFLQFFGLASLDELPPPEESRGRTDVTPKDANGDRGV
jgi:segregation and condensation protein B